MVISKGHVSLKKDEPLVPNGYKLTEVGVIPEDWECTTVGQLVRDGILEKPLDGNHGNIHPKSSDFVSFGIPFVMANNIQGGRVDFSSCAFIRKVQADSLQKGFARSGDVLLTHKATIGRTAIVEDIPYEYIMLTLQVTYYRVIDRTRLGNLYLRQFFDSSAFQTILMSMSGGGTRAYIGITAQLQLPVVLPPTTAEQEAIAKALSDVDAVIGGLDKLIAKKRDIKQAAMQQLLTGKQRLPGFGERNSQFKQTEAGVIPEDWEIRHLGCEIEGLDAGVSVNSADEDRQRYNHDQSILKTSSVANGQFLSHECKKIVPSDIHRAKLNPRCNTIIISRMNTPELVGECGYIDKDYPSLFLPDRLWMTRFRTETKLCVKWLSFLLSSSGYKSRLKNSASGTSGSMKNISKEALLALPIPFPSSEEQSAIATVLSDMNAEIAALEQRRDKTRLLKQGMMQELLTGKTRLI